MRPAPLLLLAAVLLPGCETDKPNPFADRALVEAPGPEADLVFTSDAWSPGGPRELYAVADDGTHLERLTRYNDLQPTDVAEAAPSSTPPDRAILRRATEDSNGDGRVGEGDRTGLAYVDLRRAVEATVQPPERRASSLDWSRDNDVVLFTGVEEGTLDDIIRMPPDGSTIFNLTATPLAAESRVRLDPSVSVAAFESPDAAGLSTVRLFLAVGYHQVVTTGGTGSGTVAGRAVGSDADPAFSPDSSRLVFRRLVGPGPDGRGDWDVLTVKLDGSDLTTVASGPAWRGSPDWGPGGIAYPETDPAAGTTSLVVVQPDGTGRRVLATFPANVTVSHPRWLTR